MRLCEITGNSESEVYEKLKIIRLVLASATTTDIMSNELGNLIQQIHILLNEDIENLAFYILTSDRIAIIYEQIQELRK